MKVYKCSSTRQEKTPERFSYEQIKNREGIYKSISGTSSDLRIVIITTGDCVARLVYNNNSLAALNEPWWSGSVFEAANEEVCFELRSKA